MVCAVSRTQQRIWILGLYPDDFYRLRGDRELHQAPFTGDQSFHIDDNEVFYDTQGSAEVVDARDDANNGFRVFLEDEMDRDKDRKDLITSRGTLLFGRTQVRRFGVLFFGFLRHIL